MSADQAAPELPGFAPAPEPPAPADAGTDVLVHAAFIGALMLDARRWTPTPDSWAIELLVRQHARNPHALPILARRVYTDAERHLLERIRLGELRAGVTVLVRGIGIDHYTSRTHGPVLRLLKLEHAIAFARLADTHEPSL